MSSPGPLGGLSGSLSRLLATALELARVRLALLSTEVELGAHRLFDGLLWGSLALMLLGVGIAMLSGLIVLLCWDSYRLVSLAALATAYLLAGSVLLRKARAQLVSVSGMFHLSLAELQRDGASLSSVNRDESP
jgi:uncharacterized membrane protein YqjE